MEMWTLTTETVQIPGPNNAPPVSMLFGNFPNPHPQAMQQPNPPLSTHPQPFPANYAMNNNAFSGNMSINTPSNVPHLSFGGTPMANALPFPQWAQPHLSQGMPVAPQNTAVTYPPNFSQVPCLQNNQLQGIRFQSANNNQSMGNQGVPVQNFQFPSGLQVPGTQYLPMSRPIGTQSLSAQNQNNPRNQPAQATPTQGQNENTQNQNNQNSQGQGVQGAHATRNQTSKPQLQTTSQNQGMRYPPNQIPQNQNSQPMTTQYPGNQMQNANAQYHGMGSSNTLNQGIQVPNTQYPDFQYPNNTKPQPQNANAHQNFANARLPYPIPQQSLFSGAQNKGILFQPPQALQQPSFQVPGTQYQGITSQGLGSQRLGYMNTQNPFPQAQGLPPTSTNPAEERGNSSSGNDADAEGESASEEYSWTPPPRSGGQYMTPIIQTQQTNTGDDNNTNNGQGEQSTLPNTATTAIQTQAIPTETLGGFGNPFDLTDTDTTLNNDILDQAPDLSASEMQRLLGELETGTGYDYTQGEQNNGNSNDEGQGNNKHNHQHNLSADYLPAGYSPDSGLL